MRTRRLLHLPQHALAWLLLVLLLPLAQAVAAAHAVSHLAGGETQEKQALHAAHCALCTTAATVTGGAPPAAPPRLALPDAGHEAPQALPTGLHRPAPAPAYDSRAPPAFTH